MQCDLLDALATLGYDGRLDRALVRRWVAQLVRPPVPTFIKYRRANVTSSRLVVHLLTDVTVDPLCALTMLSVPAY